MSTDTDALQRCVAEMGILEDREEERVTEDSPIGGCLAGRSLS